MAFGTALAASSCPYCGEPVQLVVDDGASPYEEQQSYIEDCQVCCRPMQVSVQFDGDGAAAVMLRSEDD